MTVPSGSVTATSLGEGGSLRADWNVHPLPRAAPPTLGMVGVDGTCGTGTGTFGTGRVGGAGSCGRLGGPGSCGGRGGAGRLGGAGSSGRPGPPSGGTQTV